MNEDQELDFLFKEAKLGISVEEWLSTDVGRYVMGRAKGELSEISIDLLAAPEWSSKTANDLRQRAAALQMLIGWLDEAISNGRISEAQLKEAENI